MKTKFQIAAVITVGFLTLQGLFLVIMAQAHYQDAVEAAIASEGTDTAVEQVMRSYGFKDDAMSQDDPSLGEKISAYLHHAK